MRTLAVTQNVTLDGSIEMVGDWFEPQGRAGVDNSDLLEVVHRHDSTADALLLGRRTFEAMRGYWPSLGEDSTGVAAYLDKVDKYVVSATMTDPRWQGTTILSGDPVVRTTTLKQRSGQDIVVTGSISLCHALIAADLVDEYRLFTYPVVQGRGRRLFPDGTSLAPMRLCDAQAFRSGITYARYVRADRSGVAP